MKASVDPFVEGEGILAESQPSMDSYEPSVADGGEKWCAVFSEDELDRVLGQEFLVAVVEVPSQEVLSIGLLDGDGSAEVGVGTQFVHVVEDHDLADGHPHTSCHRFALVVEFPPHQLSEQIKAQLMGHRESTHILGDSMQVLQELVDANSFGLSQVGVARGSRVIQVDGELVGRPSNRAGDKQQDQYAPLHRHRV